MGNAEHRDARRGEMTAAALVASALLAALAGCSSSSSPSSASATSSPGTQPSVDVTASSTLPPGPAGPNGKITAPASNAPSSGSPGGSVVFPHITQQLDRQLFPRLEKVHGVRTVTYYPQFNQMQVYFAADATATDRTRVSRIVTAAPSPTAS